MGIALQRNAKQLAMAPAAPVSPEFAQLARFMSQGRSRSAQPQEEQPFGPDQTEESLLSQVGHTGLSALGIVGNFLDLPGSMVRDALVFDNPLDQLLSPFSSENRNTGRDVLTEWGITGQNMEGGMADWGSNYGEAAADIGGFAFEMAADPLGWLTGWGSKGVGASAAAVEARMAASPTRRALGKVGDLMDWIDPGYHAGRAARRFGQQMKSPHRMGLVRKVEKILRTVEKTGSLPEGYTPAVAADHWNMVTGANAKMWAKSKEGRTEEQWFEKIDDIMSVDKDEFMAANLKQDRDILHQGNDVNSEAFKQWFGDTSVDPANASKVVDADGKPLRVYHGTTSDFEEFNNPYAEDMDGAWHMFSTSPEYSEHFTYGRDGQIMPIHLNIRNPFDLTHLPRRRGDVRNKLLDTFEDAGLDVAELEKTLPHERDLFQFIHRKGFRGNLVKALKEKGYDGIKMPDEHSGVAADTFVAFDPTQIKSVNNRGTWDPNDPNILFQGDELRRDIAPAFYSKLNRVVDSKVSGKVGLQQLKATLKKAGVKDEEIEWAEIDGLFDELEWEEVDWEQRPEFKGEVKSDNHKTLVTKERLKGWLKDHATELEETWKGHATEAETREFEAQLKDAKHVQARKEKAFFERERTSFHEKDGSYPKDLDRLKKLIENEYRADPMNQRIERNMGEIRDFPRLWEHLHRDMEQKLTGKHGGYQTGGGTNYRELLLRLKPGQTEAGSYVGGHWSEYPNTIAHVRMQDRVGPNGEKILHVEEVQSDWHKDALDTAQHKAVQRLQGRGIYSHDMTPEAFKKHLRKETILSEGYHREYIHYADTETVPDAPFKTTWHDVALKRILREAAEGGYDKLSINSGRAVGDLEMGGKQSGLDTFYDKVYPNSLNKITKKHGVRVQKDGLTLKEEQLRDYVIDNIPKGSESWAIEEDLANNNMLQPVLGPQIKEEIAQLRKLKEEAGTLWTTDFSSQFEEQAFRLDTLEHLEVLSKEYRKDPLGRVAAHTVDMTPELRKSLLEEGQPLFQGKRGAVQFAKDGRATIYAFQNSADLSTLVHETAHVFRRSLGEVDPKILAKAEAALGVATGARWSREAEESFAEQFESYMMEGKTKNTTLRPAFKAYSEWLKSIYSDVATTNPEAVSPEMKAVFGQMLGKKDPLKKTSFVRDQIMKGRLAGREAFDHAVKGSRTEVGQEGSRLHTDIEHLLKRESHEQILPVLNDMWTLATKSGEKNIHAYADRIGKVFSDALEKMPGAMDRLKVAAPELAEHVGRIQEYNRKLLQRGKEAGIRIGELKDTMAKFRHRQMSEQVKHYLETHTIGGTASSRQAGPQAVSNPAHQAARLQLYKDSYTTSIDEALSDFDAHFELDALWESGLDPESAEFVGQRLDIVEGLRKRHEFKEVNGKNVPNVSSTMKAEKDGKFRMLNEDGREVLLSSSEIEVKGGKITSRIKKQGSEAGTIIQEGDALTHAMEDRFEALVDHMMDMPVYRDTGGLFGNVFTDMESGFMAAAHSIGAAESTTKILSEGLQNGALLARATARGKEITLGALLNHPAFARLDPEHIYGRLAANNMDLVKSITKKIGKGKLKEGEGLREFNDQLSKLRVPAEIKDDFVRSWEFINARPDDTGVKAAVGNTFRSMTALFKAGVLTHPARYMRDFTSGQIANMYNKMFSPSAFMSAKNALFNQADKNLLNIPQVTEYMSHRGMEKTAENATRAVREMYAARRGHASSAYRDLDSPNTVMDAGNDLESMMDVFPGGTSGIRDLAKEMTATAFGRRRKEGASLGSAFWPANIAGVNGRRTTEFGAVAAGNIVGKHTDDMNRLVGFIERMKRGDSADDAMKMVDRVQLNYDPRTFTPTEQMLKKVFPFYSFMSRQLAYVGSELMHNPAGPLGTIIRAGRHQQDEDEFLPPGVKGTMAIPVGGGDDPLSKALAWGRSKDLPEGTKNYLAGMGLMFEESLNMLAPESSSEALRTVGKSLNPLIKGPIEWATGVSLFQGGPMGGKPLHDMDPVMGRILSQLGLQEKLPSQQAKPIFGSRVAEFAASNSPISRLLSTTRTVLDDRKGVLERAMNVTTGLRIQSVSPEQRRRGLRDQTDAIVRDLGGRAFSNMTISQSLLDSAEEGTEDHTSLLAMKELRKLWDRKRKEDLRAKEAKEN